MTGTTENEIRIHSGRGCVYFNFGANYALHLVVSLYSLRKYYDGPVTVFLAPDRHAGKLTRTLEQLGADVRLLDGLSKSCDRHRLFYESPYETTLSFDSDIIFRAPIDDLWEPLEREGVLVTRFFPDPSSRLLMLKAIRPLVDEARYQRAVRRIADEEVDINIGVMGISRPRGDGFLAEWTEHMEKGRDRSILLLDEMLVVALVGDYPHYLADEIRNCPADDIFRRTDPREAKVLHYFCDGAIIDGQRMGRNPKTWCGQFWFATYFEAKVNLGLRQWRIRDNGFPMHVEPLFANGPVHALRYCLRECERAIRRARYRLVRRAS